MDHIFSEMSHEYDDLGDVWYAWLFSRLHLLIAREVAATWHGLSPTVADIGCGTGFQSFLYARAGARVVGIDIAKGLIDVARAKAFRFRPHDPLRLFRSPFRFVARYDSIIDRLVPKATEEAFRRPTFAVGDAKALPLRNEGCDHANCCGSVLSLVDNYDLVLDEIARVLRPRGTFVIEVEGRFNADIFWSFLDVAARGKLGYEMDVRQAMELVRCPLSGEVSVEYPFGEARNPIYMNLRLFTKRGLARALLRRGLEPLRWYSIHAITNLLPSTVLDSGDLSRTIKTVFEALAGLEERCPWYLPGCSIVVFGRRVR